MANHMKGISYWEGGSKELHTIVQSIRKSVEVGGEGRRADLKVLID